MTLAQLKVFVLVSRLGTVRAAAAALGVSEPAVSQALAALRQHLDDPLIVRGGSGMELTAAGQRVLGIASQMVNLAVEAEQAVRQSKGAAALVRVVTTATLSHTVAPAVLQAFTARAGDIEVNLGVATTDEMAALVQERLADVALGPVLADLDSEAVMRYRMVHVAAPGTTGARRGMTWLVDPTGTDPRSEVGRLLARLAVPDSDVRVFPSMAAACAAAAAGEGVAPAVEHLVQRDVDRGVLVKLPITERPLDLHWYVSTLGAERRQPAVTRFRRFLGTPDAMHAMYRADGGVPASRFRPPVYVTIWS